MASDASLRTSAQSISALTRRDWRAIVAMALLCSAGASVSAWWYLEEIRGGGGAGSGPALAQVERTELKVRRKAGKSFVWSYVREREPLYRKDSVQTGAGSAAAIQFKDGTSLELGENSLIVIDDIAQLALNFKQGSLVVRDKDGVDTRISLDKGGRTQVEKLSIRLLQPESLSERWVSPTGQNSIQFTWRFSGSTAPGRYQLEISTEKSFRSTSTRAFEISESVQKAQAGLAPGTYFWRISRDGTPLSATGRFKLLPALALKPSYPGPDEVIPFRGDRATVQFRWVDPLESVSVSGNANASTSVEHRLEVATDPEFKRIVETRAVQPSASATQIPLLAGSYFWRVTSRYATLHTSSRPIAFRCEPRQQMAIRLVMPEDRASSELTQPVRLSWHAESESAEPLQYEWSVRALSGLGVASGRTSGSTALWNAPQAGSFQWRVQAINSRGEVVGESAWRDLTRIDPSKSLLAPPQLQTPRPGQLFNLQEKDFETSFEWSSVPGATRYEFTLNRLNGPKEVLVRQESIRETKFEMKDLPPGDYVWSVLGIDERNRAGASTPARKFQVFEGKPLSAPADISVEVQ